MNRNEKIAAALVLTSIGFWAGLLLVPFVAGTGSTKAILCGVLIVAGEATFWIGVLIVGREVMKRLRGRFFPKKWSWRTNGCKVNSCEFVDDSPQKVVADAAEDV